MPGPEVGVARKPPTQPQRARGRRPGPSPRKPTAIDKHVGRRLRLLRQVNEVSLEKLAEIVEVAPQQIQKYEVGETRISASRIFELSKIFGVPLTWFYDDLNAATSAEMNDRIRQYQGSAEVAKDSAADASQALLATYYRQLTPQMQGKLIDIARMLSELALAQAK